jgi:ketosteroid isomerase-like protein
VPRYAGKVPPSDAAVSDDLDAVIEQYRQAQEALVKGDPEPVKAFHSRREDVTLANPFGPVRRGWTEVADALEQAAANFRGGGGVRYEDVSRYGTPELAYVVRVERTESKVGGREELSPISLRVTMIFRREGQSWKIVHRHADPITAPRAAESITQN